MTPSMTQFHRDTMHTAQIRSLGGGATTQPVDSARAASGHDGLEALGRRSAAPPVAAAPLPDPQD